MTEKNTLFPGDVIANEEEYLPGKGTFADDGHVSAANYGVLDKDEKRREAVVEPLTPEPKPMERGLVVAGVMQQVRDNVAFVQLMPYANGKVRWVAPQDNAVLRVANVRRGYVNSLKDEFLVGDIIRAKIIHVDDDSVVLTTDAKNLGVIKAFCDRCRTKMQLIKGNLECPSCGWKGHRKIADDYGSGVLIE
jgi:exosome complex component CSL4